MTGFLNTIILLGALQGAIVCILLFRRKTNKQPDRLLAWLILLISLASFNIYFLNTGVFDTHQVLIILSNVIPLIIIMPLGPLIYFYIRSMLDPAFRLTRRHRLQFLAGIIDIVPELAAITFLVGVYIGLLEPKPAAWGFFIDQYNMYADIPRWLSLTIYLLLSYRYMKKMTATDGSNRNITGWLRQFITVFLIFQLIWLIHLVPYILPAYSNWLLDKVGWYPIYIPLSLMIYWLGIKGYLLSQAFSFNTGKKKKGGSLEIPEEVVRETIPLLNKAMEADKLYLNPALQLDLVTAHTGVPAKMVSAILNQHFQKNFNEWVNGYRVEEFKQKIGEGLLANKTIAAVASECGFNSQATFQRIFKQSQGMTPTDYLKTLN